MDAVEQDDGNENVDVTAWGQRGKRRKQAVTEQVREADESGENEGVAGQGTRARCKQCKKYFDTTNNIAGDCIWHQGKFFDSFPT